MTKNDLDPFLLVERDRQKRDKEKTVSILNYFSLIFIGTTLFLFFGHIQHCVIRFFGEDSYYNVV